MSESEFMTSYPLLWQAIQSPPTEWATYQIAVARICERLSMLFSIQLRSKGSDYCSDWIELWMSRDGVETSAQQNATYFCKLFVSIRGPFVTLVVKSRNEDGYWEILPEELYSQVLQQRQEAILEICSDEGFHILQGAILEQVIPGQSTSLDGRPATVFQLFFSELD